MATAVVSPLDLDPAHSHSVLGAGCVVRAGAVVKQRSEFAAGSEIDGFPAVEVRRVSDGSVRPAWAFASLDELPTRPGSAGAFGR
jgi:hypothetical protein